MSYYDYKDGFDKLTQLREEHLRLNKNPYRKLRPQDTYLREMKMYWWYDGTDELTFMARYLTLNANRNLGEDRDDELRTIIERYKDQDEKRIVWQEVYDYLDAVTDLAKTGVLPERCVDDIHKVNEIFATYRSELLPLEDLCQIFNHDSDMSI